jgi:ABC-type Fe3+/spermidine/putrescine transport system ATPase subunit
MPDVHVQLEHVTKRFGTDPAGPAAVDDVDLGVPHGSFTTLLGPSGCGKTTTLRMIAGFYEPDRGRILIGGRVMNDVPVHRRKIAMVFQDYALFPHMSVQDNVGYGLRLARLDRGAVAQRVGETLDFLGLSGLERRSPNQLSGGQQQRVALARALVMKPEVLLLDEPLSNLDAKLRVSIRGEFTSIQRELGLTAIYVTHDQEEALAMSDWVAVMDRGRLIQWGTPWDVYYKPETPFLADFLGSVNLVRATVASRTNGVVRVRIGSRELDVPDSSGDTARTSVLLSIRPETLELTDVGGDSEGPPRLRDAVVIPADVVGRTFLGNVMRYTVRAEDATWLVDQPDPGSAPLREGAVALVVRPSRIHVLPDRPS